MDEFDDQLELIHSEISIKAKDRRPYTRIFETTKQWLMQEMCDADPTFKKMFKGTTLFGSYPNRVRIIKPNEFDLFILLDFPFPMHVSTHPERPGFVRITSKKWRNVNNSESRATYREMFRRSILMRNKFKKWIQNIIEFVLLQRRFPKGYTISYTPCCVAHNIYVRDEANRKVSIDFVPAILMDEEYVEPLLNSQRFKEDYLETFVAIAKPLNGHGHHSSKYFQFQLVNPVAERDMIWNKQNLKVVYRLLKSLRDNYNLPRLKSYFLTAIFLYEVDRQEPEFWREPLGYIFLHMFEILLSHFEEGVLPFYWEPDFNLLSILRPKEVTKYSRILLNAYNRLVKIASDEPVSYTVRSHFKTTR